MEFALKQGVPLVWWQALGQALDQGVFRLLPRSPNGGAAAMVRCGRHPRYGWRPGARLSRG